jgi:hypothetical protein
MYPKILGTFYMQGYKVKEKTAIVPPVSKLSGHPASQFIWFRSPIKVSIELLLVLFIITLTLDN